MKFLLVVVGAVCLVGTIHAQSALSTAVAKAIATSNTNLATAIQTVNNTINAADKTVLTGWNSYITSMVNLYTTQYNKFKSYTSIDLSQINSAITSMQSMSSMTPMPMQDGSISQIFSSLQLNAQQIGSTLTAAAANMSSGTGTYLATCTTKYGAKLSVTPITIDRVRDCIAAEATRYTSIASNVTAQYTAAVTSATNYLSVVSVCDTPAPAVINNPPMNGQPQSIQCLTNFLQKLTSMPSTTSSADNMRYSQLQMVSQRAQRCGRLVQLDVQDRVSAVLNSFNTCLKTGS